MTALDKKNMSRMLGTWCGSLLVASGMPAFDHKRIHGGKGSADASAPHFQHYGSLKRY